MMKPNCYKCKFRRDIAGGAHSSCEHPSFAEFLNNPICKLSGILASVGRLPPIQALSKEIKVKGNSHGIKSGWFNHPFNFDPVWLEECNGFEPKEPPSPR